LHIEPGQPCILGDRVTLGHRVTVHASLVEEHGAVALESSVVVDTFRPPRDDYR